uniref:AlNc14C11G1407 protein n=1 Tax=Albugo laibachii Nc14 TaxID=890382 RepID=F0W329_9STRA|nr:AlNc14C11G1407 [Albugo laibachii Nc14]|eukprot:CCA15466.1 AlNc14C11G1407 [Albugo laibachii Nc14]
MYPLSQSNDLLGARELTQRIENMQSKKEDVTDGNWSLCFQVYHSAHRQRDFPLVFRVVVALKRQIYADDQTSPT